MNASWTPTLFAAPSVLGALFGFAIDQYASWIDEEIAVDSAALAQPATGPHLPLLEKVTEITSDGLRAKAPGAAPSVRSVDAVQHAGRTYLALRTESPANAAAAELVVVSSRDQQSWRTELTLARPRAIGGPRLLGFEGKLFLYFSEAAATEQQPSRNFAVELTYAGTWTEPMAMGLPGHVISRTALVDGIALMTAVVGKAPLYRLDEATGEVRLLTTRDGVHWHPPSATKLAVYRGGGEDSTFASGDDGNLLAVVRNEGGDSSGWGSSVCLAAASEWTNWDCVNDPRSYGAATLFNHDEELYLVGRRQLGDGGAYDRGLGTGVLRVAWNQAEQLTTGKRCAVWRLDRTSRQFVFVTDLPSKGDTCAAAVVPGPHPNTFAIYAQSSDLSGPDLHLAAGLGRQNHLYRYELSLTPTLARRSNDTGPNLEAALRR